MRVRFWWTAFVLTAREVLRGRLVLLLLVLVPTLFFLVAGLTTTDAPVGFELALRQSDELVTVPQERQATVFIGLSATGLLTSFIGLRLLQREADQHQRLVLCGYRAIELVTAKLAVLLVVVTLVALYVAAALPLFFFDVDRFGSLFAGFVAGGWVYGCYGMLVGALLRKELEGILFVALLTNVDSGWLQNPMLYAQAENQGLIRALPAHLASQVSLAAAFTDEPVAGPLIGAFLYGLLLLVLALGVFAWRTRRR